MRKLLLAAVGVAIIAASAPASAEESSEDVCRRVVPTARIMEAPAEGPVWADISDITLGRLEKEALVKRAVAGNASAQQLRSDCLLFLQGVLEARTVTRGPSEQ
jgi:hypothetical protein